MTTMSLVLLVIFVVLIVLYVGRHNRLDQEG
jgi:putative solute:sodium symporter small subunit